MKKSSVLMIAVIMLLSSCGTFNQLASSADNQKFSDGIYASSPSFRSKDEKVQSKAETDALIAKTKESSIYLFGDRKDTIMIPDNYSATIKYDKTLGSTVVTVGENPYDWRMNLNPWSYYTPYSIGSSWYWSRHWSPFWSMSPMAYSYGWYDPWYYGWNDPWFYGWNDPWYYGGYWGRWYDPFDYWGYWGWGGPWYYGSYWGSYYSWYPYYVGGWYPNYGFHGGPGIGHGGHISTNRSYVPRYETEGDTRVFADNGRTAFRRGSGISSSTSRGTVGSSSVSRSSATKSESRVTAGKRTVARSSEQASSSSNRTATYRKPSAPAGGSLESAGSYTRSTASSSQSRGTATSGSTVSRGSSTYDRSSSGNSYNRSTSTPTRSSSYSSGGGGSYSRSSSGGSSSGGGSRGGSSSGRR